MLWSIVKFLWKRDADTAFNVILRLRKYLGPVDLFCAADVILEAYYGEREQ